MEKLFTIRNILLTILPSMCAGVCIACSGFGSETTNGRISGKVVLPDGSPAANVTVTVRKSGYLKPLPALSKNAVVYSLRNSFTDRDGNFALDSLDTGSYRIEFNNQISLAALSSFSILIDRKAVDAGTKTLKNFASVHGEVNIGGHTGDLYVQVYGLERLEPVSPDGSFAIRDLPEGTFTLRILGRDTTVQPITVRNVKALSGAEISVPVVGWKYSKKLMLNTASTGANVSETVYWFPVLVRLTNANFNFSQAGKNGRDLRFMKSDSSAMLSYEVESWDSTNGSAAVWVLVDTVYGNNAAQSIVMEWGNGTAASGSSGAGVFRSDKGFSAVWHLNGTCVDASANGYNGTASGTVDTAGMAGGCKKFRNSDFVRIPGQLGMPSSVTLSAWAKLDSVAVSGGEVITLGDAVLLRLDDTRDTVVAANGSIHLYSANADTLYQNLFYKRSYNKTGWHNLALTLDNINKVQTLYIDGSPIVIENSKNSSIDYSGVGTDTYIGKHGNNSSVYNFIGTIDEVRVQHVAVSAGWVKLCYQNQKLADALVGY